VYIADTAIVLNSVRYDDSSSVVHLFTRSCGTESFAASRPRSQNSAHKALSSLLSPLNILSFQWDHRPTRQLHRFRGSVSATPVWQTIPYHPVKRAVTLLLAECMAAMLREEGENKPLFDFVTASLQWFDNASDGYANFHLVFLLHVARAIGVAPDVATYAPGYSFDIESALFVASAPSSPLVMTPPDAEALYRLCQTDYDNMSSIGLAHTDRRRLLVYMNRFFTVHLPAFPQLKSPDILAELFATNH